MKVYVIQQGEYSDRHIVGVVADENEAKRVSRAISGNIGYNHGFYEEFDTDQFKNNLLGFIVSDYYGCGFWKAEYDPYTDYKDNVRLNDHKYIIYAKDKEQAVKIAQDMEAEYQAGLKGVKL